jgi:hypothetical protein
VIVVEHDRCRADASWRIYALTHAVFEVFNFLLRNSFRVHRVGRAEKKRHVNEGHIVQHKQLGQPRRIN